MNSDKPKTEFDRRLEAFQKDRLMRAVYFIAVTAAFVGLCSGGFDHRPSRWATCTMLGGTALIVERLCRYRLWAPAMFLVLVVGDVSLTFSVLSTRANPQDPTGIFLTLGALSLIATALHLAIRNLRERRRLAATDSRG